MENTINNNTMNDLNKRMNIEINKNPGLARVFGLSNNTAINRFKNGKCNSLSNETYIKIGRVTGHKLVQLMVPDDTDMDEISALNDSFIAAVNEKLTESKRIREENKEKDQEKSKKETQKILNNSNNNVIEIDINIGE